MDSLKRISEYFNIPEDIFEKTGAFNAIMGVDSLFFVDPLLLSKSVVPELDGSLDSVRKYFNQIIILIRANNQMAFEKAVKRLILGEIKGVGIGYGNSTDDGSAIGPELAANLADTAKALIKMGIDDPAIFEVMGLFEENYGPDRLSDALINILQERLYGYTERIADELGIPRKLKIIKYSKTFYLPIHPVGKKPLIFIPSDILRHLPVATSYNDISMLACFNNDLRERFNRLIAPCFESPVKPDKKTIKRYLLQSHEIMDTLVCSYIEVIPDHYDFANDPRGLYSWLEKSKKAFDLYPVAIPHKVQEDELGKNVSKIIDSFKKSIEVGGCWRQLYDDEMRPLNEKHARLFFYGIARFACESSNIDISPESNAGMGPVDFKLSTGSHKIVIEVKLSKGKVKQGYEKQTRIYQESENADLSYFVVVKVAEVCKSLDEILMMQKEEDEKKLKHPEIIIVDGSIKKSASKIR